MECLTSSAQWLLADGCGKTLDAQSSVKWVEAGEIAEHRVGLSNHGGVCKS
jgi:hypothetical protein